TLAQVDQVAEDSRPGLSRDSRGPVLGAIVHHVDARGRTIRFRADPLDDGSDPALLVLGRDDDGDRAHAPIISGVSEESQTAPGGLRRPDCRSKRLAAATAPVP